MQLMLGKPLPLDKIQYPCLVSVKFDGMQAITLPKETRRINKRDIETNLVSRNFKPVPNEYVRKQLECLPQGFQGELIASGKTFTESMSGLRRFDGEPEFEFVIFNYFGSYEPEFLQKPYWERMLAAEKVLRSYDAPQVRIVHQTGAHDFNTLEAIIADIISQGHEGAMITYPNAPYDCFRSPNLVKVKNFEEEEFEIVGFIPERYCDTVANRAANLVGTDKDKLGSIECRVPGSGLHFFAACGFDDTYAEQIWRNQSKYLGKKLTVKYLKSGTTDRPRHPVGKIVRDYE